MLTLNRMTTLTRILIAVMVGWMMLALSPWVPAAHAATTPCSDDEVTVMVQGYSPACSPAGGNGYQTLINAGFSVEVTQKFPDFICRINSYPDAGVDKCLTASPTTAYWTYWHAPLGGNSWTYSDLGAFGRYPGAGTVEAWTWGPGLEPGSIPVSRTVSTDDSDSVSGGLPDLTLPPAPTFDWDRETPRNEQNASTTPRPSGEPEPEENPENPDEVLVFLDSEGNRISRQDYEELVAAASRAAETRIAPGAPAGAPAGGAAGSTAAGTSAAETTTEEPDPKSTRVMTAPVLEDTPLVQADGQGVIPQYDATTNAQGTDGGSQAWVIAMTIAFIVLLGGAAAATWVLRRGEVHG